MYNFLNLALFNLNNNGGCYYYSRLTNEQKKIYNKILFGVKTHTPSIKLPLRPINEIAKIYNCILLDYPIIFYVLPSFTHSSDLNKNKRVIIPEYRYMRGEIRAYTNDILNYLRKLDSVKGKKDIDKELYVHDFCLNNLSYDYSFAEQSHSVLGPVINKKGVCEGIAKFVKSAFDYLGIKSLIVSGKVKNPVQNAGSEGHSWNMVMIDGNTYHLDVTFDMAIQNNVPRYDYFDLSDAEIIKDHIITDDIPACVTPVKGYYSKNH